MLPSFDEQAHQALRNLGALLREAGGGYRDVMFVQLYLLDMEKIERFNEIFRGYFPEEPPARAVCQPLRLYTGAESCSRPSPVCRQDGFMSVRLTVETEKATHPNSGAKSEPAHPRAALLVVISDNNFRRSGLQMQTGLTLRLPRQDEEEEFLRAHRATSPEVPDFLHYYKGGMPLSRYLEVLAEQERGANLPANHVPSTFLFAFVATRIVGRVSIRHSLNEFQSVWAGIAAMSSFRKSVGWATLLRSSVVRPNCSRQARYRSDLSDLRRRQHRFDQNNRKERWHIENVVIWTDPDKPKRRYWIEAG
jgi:enamine deaminase RidA (YjgF/YER057c/UK114 family)